MFHPKDTKNSKCNYLWLTEQVNLNKIKHNLKLKRRIYPQKLVIARSKLDLAQFGRCRTQFLPRGGLICIICIHSHFFEHPLSFQPSSQVIMVVIHAEPSTSSPAHKKNRRKLNKKRTAGQDADMHEDSMPSAPAERGVDGTPQDDELMIDVEEAGVSATMGVPAFAPLPASAQRTTLKSETRRIPMPPHRMTPLKKEWVNIFGPLTEILGLQVRMNVQRRCVEIRVRV